MPKGVKNVPVNAKILEGKSGKLTVCDQQWVRCLVVLQYYAEDKTEMQHSWIDSQICQTYQASLL